MEAVTEPEDGRSGWLSSEVETGRDLGGLGVLFLTMIANGHPLGWLAATNDDGTQQCNEGEQDEIPSRCKQSLCRACSADKTRILDDFCGAATLPTFFSSSW